MSNPVNWRQTVERAEKREFVTELNEVFKASGSVVVAHYAGVTVAQMNDFRSKMRAAGGTIRVAKNRLARIALQGTESEGMTDLFKGQTLIAFSADPITAPKVVMDFARTNDKLVVLGGAMGATPKVSSRLRPCLRSTSCARNCWASSTPRQPASRRLLQHRQASLLACSRPMPRRTKPPEAEFRCCS
jgi:ribosomal protein L10